MFWPGSHVPGPGLVWLGPGIGIDAGAGAGVPGIGVGVPGDPWYGLVWPGIGVPGPGAMAWACLHCIVCCDAG